MFAFARVNEQCSPCKPALAGSMKLGKNRNQFDGKIVDTIKTHVLKRVEDSAFSRAGKSGEDDKLAGFGSVG